MRRSREAILEEISTENAKIHGNPCNLQEILTRRCFRSAGFMIIYVIPIKFQCFSCVPLKFQQKSSPRFHAHILRVEFLTVQRLASRLVIFGNFGIWLRTFHLSPQRFPRDRPAIFLRGWLGNGKTFAQINSFYINIAAMPIEIDCSPHV